MTGEDRNEMYQKVSYETGWIDALEYERDRTCMWTDYGYDMLTDSISYRTCEGAETYEWRPKFCPHCGHRVVIRETVL